MIRIHRAPEPTALSTARATRLPAARAAVATAAKINFDDYDAGKTELAAMQHQKCCYCEKREEQAKYRDVEHYRPKAQYWWLAWTWENLLFSCIDCNREFKRDQFPLSSADTRLTAEQAPPGLEHPLVIDPSDPKVDPMAEIEFKPVRIGRVERWTPFGKSPRARETIKVCGLDRPSLLDLYGDHVNRQVRREIRFLFAAHHSEDARAVVEEWSTVTRALLNPAAPFRGLSHDALAVLVPAAIRARYQLVLRRP